MEIRVKQTDTHNRASLLSSMLHSGLVTALPAKAPRIRSWGWQNVGGPHAFLYSVTHNCALLGSEMHDSRLPSSFYLQLLIQENKLVEHLFSWRELFFNQSLEQLASSNTQKVSLTSILCSQKLREQLQSSSLASSSDNQIKIFS